MPSKQPDGLYEVVTRRPDGHETVIRTVAGTEAAAVDKVEADHEVPRDRVESSPPTGSPESPVGPRKSHRLPRLLLLLQRLSDPRSGSLLIRSEYCLTCVDPLSRTGG